MIYVGTGLTSNYFPKTQHFHFFPTLNQLAAGRVKTFSVLLDYLPPEVEEMRRMFPNILFVPMRSEDVRQPNPNKCMQHGAFLEALVVAAGLTQEDYVIFTDSDMTVQRRFDDWELDKLVERVFVAMNWHDTETLGEELPALGPVVPPFVVEQVFPGFSKMLCYNTGVFGATVAQWRKVFDRYVELYAGVCKLMSHYARQQWLLSWIIQNDGIPTHDPLSEFVRNIHIHGHEPYRQQRILSNKIELVNGRFCRAGSPIVFAHNLR